MPGAGTRILRTMVAQIRAAAVEMQLPTTRLVGQHVGRLPDTREGQVSSSPQFARLRGLMGGEVGSYGGNNTCAHRGDALAGLLLGLEVVDLTIRKFSILERLNRLLFRSGLPIPHPRRREVSSRFLAACSVAQYDLIWLDKALAVSSDALREARELQPSALLVGYSPDDMAGRHNQSQEFLEGLPIYDAYVTTKSYNVAELSSLGARRVIFVDNAYSEKVFRPLPSSVADAERLGGDVGFIGTYERARAESMLKIAEAGMNVRVWGEGWERCPFKHRNLRLEARPLLGDEFAQACGAFKVNLGFLRKVNRDLQTTRSVEIPACGGFMLAERTREHERLFVEGQEAEFFSSEEELVRKCRYYLEHEEERSQVAAGGRRRCVDGDYSNTGRLRQVLSRLLEGVD